LLREVAVTGADAWLDRLRHESARRESAGLRRRLIERTATDATVDMAGNDYLGLSRHPLVIEAAAEALHAYGLGATGSRLVRGTTSAHVELERALAGWLGVDDALVYSSGYLANLGAIRALATPNTLIISDAYNHASIVDGCRAVRAEIAVTKHLSLRDIESALASARQQHRPALVVTESIFSVDGDLAPLAEIHELTRAYGARLLIDDAHAVGVIGPQGCGGAAAAGIAGQPDVIVTITLSKSFGGAGGVIAGPAEFIATLVDTGRTFIYDTGMPPPVAAGARAALDVIADGDDLRDELLSRSLLIRKVLGNAGLDVSTPAGGVLSVMAASPEDALRWAAACRDRGVAVGCFRPPSTPDGSSRLRLTINVGVPRDEFERALNVIVETQP
jgi:8-amino-7-oxononanoate synthase